MKQVQYIYIYILNTLCYSRSEAISRVDETYMYLFSQDMQATLTFQTDFEITIFQKCPNMNLVPSDWTLACLGCCLMEKLITLCAKLLNCGL